MANRHTLHINKLDSFKKWLVKDGWELLPLSNNYYEVLRAQKAGKQYPLIIYSGKSSEHLSLADRDMSVVGAFLRDSKKLQTNADRIRSMTDEELALAIMCPAEYDSNFNKRETCNGEMNKNCYECSLKWLREESEG